MAWNGWKSVLAQLEWLGMEEVGFGLTGMAWNRGNCFLALLEWFGIEEVSLGCL
jgi:hypothetical protein